MKKDLDLHRRWAKAMGHLADLMGKRPRDMNAVLFLIGVNELGRGPRAFSKEEKQDLMHIALCKVLSYGGFYALEGQDEDGWPHWKKLKPVPHIDVADQETLLKHYVLDYCEQELQLDTSL